MDMIIQAGTLFANILRKPAAAGAQTIDFIEQVNGILDCSRTRLWSEIARFILLHRSGKKHSRIILRYRYLDIRISLVIPEHGVVLRAMLLDQIAL